MIRRHHIGQPRRPPPARQSRFKRPLVVLTYHDDQLDSIHSSTPTVQFVRLDLGSRLTIPVEDTAFPPSNTARLLSVSSLAELPTDLRLAAQRAFRRS